MIVSAWEVVNRGLGAAMYEDRRAFDVQDPDAVVEVVCALHNGIDPTDGFVFVLDTREVPRLAAALGFEGTAMIDADPGAENVKRRPAARSELSRRLDAEFDASRAESDATIAEALRKLG